MATTHKSFCVVVAGAMAAAVMTAGPSAGRDRAVTLTVDDRSRTYHLFVPGPPADGRYRLVVALHPLGNTGLDFEQDSNLDQGAAAANALVAYPDGVDGSWNAGRCCAAARDEGVDDVAFLDAVIDDVEASYPVDTSEIAMGGLSNGALMAYRYVCERSSRVRVVFVASGALVAPSCGFSRPVQILHMHGMKDALVPWAGDQHSRYTSDHVMPSVRESTDAVAKVDGCTPGDWSQRRVNGLVTDYSATGCPAGAGITVAASRTLAHGWATGQSSVAQYGIDETHAVWTFILGNWE